MLRSYLTLAVRTLRRRLGYTLVNLIGLTIGLACCATVAVFLQYELRYDTHHKDADRIYRILRDFRTSTYSTVAFQGYNSASPATQRALAERLPEALPDVEQATNFDIFSDPLFVRTEDGRSFESTRYLMTNTGPAFADVFTFDTVAGEPLEDALAQPYSVALTESAAATYFGDQNPIGETLQLDSLTTTVRAVIADPPTNSRITFDFAVQVKKIPNYGAFHYMRLAEGTDPDALAPQITQVMDEVYPWRVENASMAKNGKGEQLQSLTDIHLAKRALYDDSPHRNPAYLWAFGAIGLLILIITTINYANLALALYADRNQEIGVRKAMGGYRGQIAGQFLAEAGLLAVACVPLALGLCALVLPGFNAIMETDISRLRLLQPEIAASVFGLALVTGLAAGGYPAFVMARKRAVDLFGQSASAGRAGRVGSLRHGLIALQFVVLIGLGSLSWMAYDQLRFMQDSDLGYETGSVVQLRNFRTRDSTEYLQLKQRLERASAIEAVGTGVIPGPGGNRSNYTRPGSDIVHRDVYSEIVDVGWFSAMGVRHPVADSMREAGLSGPQRVLINEAAAQRFGFANPVGQEIILGPSYDEPIRMTIDGVLPDMHFRPMRQEIKPTVFRVRPVRSATFGAIVRFAPERTEGWDGAGAQRVERDSPGHAAIRRLPRRPGRHAVRSGKPVHAARRRADRAGDSACGDRTRESRRLPDAPPPQRNRHPEGARRLRREHRRAAQPRIRGHRRGGVCCGRAAGMVDRRPVAGPVRLPGGGVRACLRRCRTRRSARRARHRQPASLPCRPDRPCEGSPIRVISALCRSSQLSRLRCPHVSVRRMCAAAQPGENR